MKKITLFLALCVAMTLTAQTMVEIENQKMVLTNHGVTTVLAPQGDDESYYWASISPDGERLLYATAHHGAFITDLQGNVLRSLGNLDAPKWMDNETIGGMNEVYTETGILSHYLYKCVNPDGTQRELTAEETGEFIRLENERRLELTRRHALRAPARAADGEAGLAGLKIYLNPGHGGYDANDRSCWTVNVPETWKHPEGYWESKSNLVKGLFLRDMLQAAGATVIISRTTNNSGVRDLEYYPNATADERAALIAGDDRDLTAIAEEANANEVDHFLSIHSNALNAQTNYLLMLYHGEQGKPTVSPSDQMATLAGSIQIQNQLTVWTSPNPLIRGDITFYGDSPTDPYAGLGVLRPLTVPGHLSEGSFHDYPPETHRLMNDNYCKIEALRMFQYFHRYYNRTLPQTACISGWVKSGNEKVDVLGEPKFTYVKYSDDQWLPLNGAKVVLIDANGARIDSLVTDNEYNGVFAFFDLTPGTYSVEVSKQKYETLKETVTVVAEQIAGLKVRPNNIRLEVEDFQNGGGDAMPLDNYLFETVSDLTAVPAGVTRIAYRDGYVYMIQDGSLVRQALAGGALEALPMPDGVKYADLAFSADGYLLARTIDTDALTVYSYDSQFTAADLLFSKPQAGLGTAMAVQGPLWKAKVYAPMADNLFCVTYDADAPANIAATTVAAAGMTAADRIVLTPAGNIEASQGESWLKYAGVNYKAVPVLDNGAAVGFMLYNEQNTAVSAKYPDAGLGTAAAGWAQALVWSEGYEIHVIIAAEGEGMQHFRTIAQPVANIYAAECRFDSLTNKFSFRLNEDATAVVLSIEKDGEMSDSRSYGAMTKGLHTVDNPFVGAEFDAWSVSAAARPVSYPVKISDDSEKFQFWSPRGVEVDKTPTSPYFGRVYVAECAGGRCSNDAGGGWPAPSYRTTTQGIYVMGSDFSDVTGQGNNAYNGGVKWGDNTSKAYQYAVRGIGVAENGDVYVTSSSASSVGVYLMNPAQPSDNFVSVLAGTKKKHVDPETGEYVYDGQLVKKSTIICNAVQDVAIRGTGKNLKLYTYDRAVAGEEGNSNIWRYDIGTLDSLPWNDAPSAVEFNNLNNENHVRNGFGQIAYDGHGGWWMSQYRAGTNSWAVPGLMHETGGEMDFNLASTDFKSEDKVKGTYMGGMAVSVDGSVVAIGTDVGIVRVFDVTYDQNNKPDLSDKCTINWGNGAGNTIGMDFDPAGNLYIVSNSNERLMVYAMPTLNNVCTTRIPLKVKADDSAVDNVRGVNVFVYPNPATEYLHIDGNITAYQLYSLNGTMLRSEKVSGSTVLNVAGLAEGTYIVRTEDAGGAQVFSFVKK